MRRFIRLISVLAACIAAGAARAGFYSFMPAQDMKFLGRKDSRALAPVDDHSYDSIRDVVSVLHLDLGKITE